MICVGFVCLWLFLLPVFVFQIGYVSNSCVKTGKVWELTELRESVWLNTLRGIKAVKSVYCRVFALVVRKALRREKCYFDGSWLNMCTYSSHEATQMLTFGWEFLKERFALLKKHNQIFFFPRLCNLNIAINAWRGKCKIFIDWNTLLYQHIQKEYTKRYKPSNSSVQ